jgi:uncharacterized oligopeptide transporter (OPT) family protein
MQRAAATTRRHPAFFSLASLALITPLCVVGAIIGTQLIVTLGITTNTSLIGALAGMALGRLPLAYLSRYKSVHLQNLAQSAISAATFGAGNALLLPVGIPFVMGRPDLVEPMLLGVFLAMLVDGYMLYRMFDSEVFPASGAWPPGVAAAEAIRAGDEGGRKLGVLGLGVAVITLVIGMLIGFPPPALTLLVGFSAATGPAFADMGYDLKAGFILRGQGADAEFEREGRKQQLFAAMFAFVVAGVVVTLSYRFYFANNLVAPIDRAYAATIKAGAAPGVAHQLLMWAVPGALLQFLGGPKRQMGVLLATGLLLGGPAAGYAVLVGIVLRLIWTRYSPKEWRADMEVFAAGVIAGDALSSFYDMGSKYFATRSP